MLIYNIKTQVEFNLGYNPLIFYILQSYGPFIKNIVQKLVSAQYQNLVSAQLPLKDCIELIQIWYSTLHADSPLSAKLRGKFKLCEETHEKHYLGHSQNSAEFRGVYKFPGRKT